MPTIVKNRKKSSYQKHGKNKEISKIYNSTQWVNLRKAYLMEHPLCEMCLEDDKITAATEVHHIYEISNGKDIEEMKDIAYNPWNYEGLRALCSECHQKIHGKLEFLKDGTIYKSKKD